MDEKNHLYVLWTNDNPMTAETGVHITACKACADQLGVTAELENLGIEVKYWGKPLTRLLKDDETLLTV